MEQPIKEQQQ